MLHNKGNTIPYYSEDFVATPQVSPTRLYVNTMQCHSIF